MHPAARALGTGSLNDGDLETGVLGAGAVDSFCIFLAVLSDEALGDNEELFKVHVGDCFDCFLGCIVGDADGDGGFEGLADTLGSAGCFENTVDIVTDGNEGIPLCELLSGESILGEGLIQLRTTLRTSSLSLWGIASQISSQVKARMGANILVMLSRMR